VAHHWGASSKLRKEWATTQLYRGKRLYYVKHYGGSAELCLRLGLAVRFSLRLLLAGVTFPFRKEVARYQIGLYRGLLKDLSRALPSDATGPVSHPTI
jgi:hypothetical protein